MLIKYDSGALIEVLARDIDFVKEHAKRLQNIPPSKTKGELINFVKNMKDPYEALARFNIGMEDFNSYEKKKMESGISKSYESYEKENSKLSKIFDEAAYRKHSEDLYKNYDSKMIVDLLFKDPKIEAKYGPQLKENFLF